MSNQHEHHDTQGEQRSDERDAMLHANLEALGRRIGPMPAPSAERIRSWRGAAVELAPEALRLSGAGGSPAAAPARSHRSRWLAAGSAIAAGIAITTVMLLQPWGGTVEASTIIQGLRSKTFGGVNLRFDHFASHGTTVDGTIRLRLNREVSIETLDQPHALDAPGHFGAAYGKFTITTDDTVPGWGGGRVDAEGAITRNSGWMFVKAADETVKQVAAADPCAAGLARMAASGVVLNVGGLDDSFFDGLSAAVGAGGPPGLHATLGPSADGRGVTLGARLSDGAHSPSVEQVRRFAALARMLLSGKARQGELDQLRRMIQDDFSQQAKVQPLGGGRYLLTAEIVDPERARSDRAPDATLTVCYEEAGGVQWAEITKMRDATGLIRIDFASDPIEPGLLGYDRLVQTGSTNYVDLRMIMRMFMPGGRSQEPNGSQEEPN